MTDPSGRVVLDPDAGVQAAVRTFFETFRRTGSATATVRHFREQGWLFPRRLACGPHAGEVAWGPLIHHHALRLLKNPRYTGAFVYGRTRARRTATGTASRIGLPREEWHTLLLDRHPGYISWDEYEANLRRLAENAQARGSERRAGPPREGPALLQGLVVCGRCGGRMGVRYYSAHGTLVPEYHCQREGIEHAQPLCARIVGHGIDRAIGDLLVETVSPLAIEAALGIEAELAGRAAEADGLRRTQVERARYEAELAQRRYLRVDPDNRLVADSLEADWNAKLRAQVAAQQEYERGREAERGLVDPAERARILALATDFPRLWADPATPQRERKRMVRLMLDDVTLVRTDELVAHVRFRGGAIRTIRLPLPRSAADLRRTDPAVIAELDRLLDDHTDAQVAELGQHVYRPSDLRQTVPTGPFLLGGWDAGAVVSACIPMIEGAANPPCPSFEALAETRGGPMAIAVRWGPFSVHGSPALVLRVTAEPAPTCVSTPPGGCPGVSVTVQDVLWAGDPGPGPPSTP